MKVRATVQMPDPAKVDQSNKVIIVTGANAGIGYETTKFIAGLHPKKLIMACR
jgi:retinol dehydrogenase-12